MKYINTVKAIFIDRPNRFIANVRLEDGRVETVHVKNTGRCRELLILGVEVMLQDAYAPVEDKGHDDSLISSYNPARKTRFDLIAVKKEGIGWINIDSQVPNKVVNEWLKKGNTLFKQLDVIRPEYKYGNSRVDYYLEKGNKSILMEVKGCTLEIEGTGYFPDAPTQRGVKHLKELGQACKAGFECYLAFVIAINGVDVVYPNIAMHPEFGTSLQEAREQGLKILYLECFVSEDEIYVVNVKQSE